MNGNPGDHPIRDIMVHHHSVYGEPLDAQLRELGELISYQRLSDWFQQHWLRRQIRFSPLSQQSFPAGEVRRRIVAGRTPAS
jgi:hypothetical protein